MKVSSSRTRGFTGLLASITVLVLERCSLPDSKPLELLGLDDVCGCIVGILPIKGVRGCLEFDELPKELAPLSKLDSIFTGEGGRKDLDLSAST